MFGEFKAFLTKSNALALAIGVIIGAALGAVVNSLVNDTTNSVIAFIPSTTNGFVHQRQPRTSMIQ